jgi:hypothetical protein
LVVNYDNIIYIIIANSVTPIPNFGGGVGQIFLDNLGCTGMENSIFDCPHNRIHDCTHAQDAGVVCDSMFNKNYIYHCYVRGHSDNYICMHDCCYIVVCLPPCINGMCNIKNFCICSPGYTGGVCDVPIVAECEVNPCQNGGNCSMVAMTPVCDCPVDFGGPRCEIPCMSCTVMNFIKSGYIHHVHYSTQGSR